MSVSCLYEGTVFHNRHTPKQHKLSYKVFTLYADIDELNALSKKLRLFSFNRFNLISLHEKDYGNPATAKDAPVKERLLLLLEQNGIESAKVATIKMLTYPRILGFSFNPLTVFYCFGRDGKAKAVIYEVRNTFGERHNYIYAIPEGRGLDTPHSTQKRFHVSPFFDRNGKYTFQLSDAEETSTVLINYAHNGQKRLTAGWFGRRKALNDKTILALCLKFPFMTLKVVGGILYEALILWMKGIRVVTRPSNHTYQSSLASPAVELHPQQLYPVPQLSPPESAGEAPYTQLEEV